MARKSRDLPPLNGFLGSYVQAVEAALRHKRRLFYYHIGKMNEAYDRICAELEEMTPPKPKVKYK